MKTKMKKFVCMALVVVMAMACLVGCGSSAPASEGGSQAASADTIKIGWLGPLTGGEQQMLAMGRALMSKPSLMMLDEPSMGLAPILVEQVFDIIRELHEAGTTILLVEQNAQMALSIADRAYVLETGKISLSGTGRELAESESVRKAYLGG